MHIEPPCKQNKQPVFVHFELFLAVKLFQILVFNG